MSESPQKLRIVSLDVDVVEFDELIKRIDELRVSGGGYVCFSTVHMVMEAFDDKDYADIVNAADIIVPDGMPLVWMQKLATIPNATRVRANDLMIGLCRFAEAKGLSVGFYGASEEVIERIRERISRDFPRLSVAYAFSPPFRPLTETEDESIVNEITAARPDFLFVGLGCPKQERWMNAHRDRSDAVMLGVGASFDFFAGNVSECPPWIGAMGLEWLFRLVQEPRRLWKRYLVHNPRFAVKAGVEALKRRK
jgi:N-acetylglucosaminyldiphosphoundecaprenol N-acetyl-beta-D-mannosaminyltransferase